MPFNGWDELPHIAVAYYTGIHGHMPSPRTPMPRELIPFIAAHPHPTASLCMLRGIDAKPYSGSDPACGVEPKKRYDMFLYEAQQGPLFYWLAGLFCPGPDPARMLAWADTVRACNIALLLGTLVFWRISLQRLLPGQGPLSWLGDGVLLLVASFSYVPYNFVRFANDGLALFCGSAALALYVVWVRPRNPAETGRIWRAGLLGLLAGLAVLAKATAMPLALTLGLALGWPALARRRGWRDRLVTLGAPLAFAMGYACLAGWYHLHYLTRYGRLTGMQEAIVTAKRGMGAERLLEALGNLGYGLFRNPWLYNSTVHLAGWSGVHSPDWLNLGFKTAVSGCVLAFLAAMLRPENRRQAAELLRDAPELPLLWLLCSLALGYHALHATLVWGFPTSGGWYAMAGLPVLFAALLAGAALLGQEVGLAALLLLVFLFNAGAMGGTYAALPAQETGTDDFYKAARTLAGHHSLPGLDLKYILIAEMVFLAGAVSLTVRRMLAATTRTQAGDSRLASSSAQRL